MTVLICAAALGITSLPRLNSTTMKTYLPLTILEGNVSSIQYSDKGE